MTIRISRFDDFGEDFDTKFIESALAEDTRDEMSPAEVEQLDFTEKGIIPNCVAASKASSFGLRHSYFDVWKPIDTNAKGVWHLQKDADGNDVIIRADA